MNKFNMVLLVVLVPGFLFAEAGTKTPSSVLDVSKVPAHLQEYVGMAPDSFVKNMNILMRGGMTEAGAYEEMRLRLIVKLKQGKKRKEEEYRLAKFEREVLDNLGYMSRKVVEKNPEKYWAAVERFGSGEPVWDDDLWLINIKRKYRQRGFEHALGANPSYLYKELRIANLGIELRSDIWMLEYSLEQLAGMCAPNEMPEVSFEYRNKQRSVDERLRIVEAESNKVRLYVKHYAAKEARWAELMARLKRIEENQWMY